MLNLCARHYDLGLRDIEMMHCDYCYIALKHLAVVNKARHHPISVPPVKLTSNSQILDHRWQEYIDFSVIVDAVHSILQHPTAIFSNILCM